MLVHNVYDMLSIAKLALELIFDKYCLSSYKSVLIYGILILTAKKKTQLMQCCNWLNLNQVFAIIVFIFFGR